MKWQKASGSKPRREKAGRAGAWATPPPAENFIMSKRKAARSPGRGNGRLALILLMMVPADRPALRRKPAGTDQSSSSAPVYSW